VDVGKVADGRDARAELHHVTLAARRNDVRQRVEHARVSAEHDDHPGPVAFPARDVVRVGEHFDHRSVLRREHGRSCARRQVYAGVPTRALRAFCHPRAAPRDGRETPHGPRARRHGAGQPAEVSPRRKLTLHRHVVLAS
jgi:hypothetical protein